MVCRASRDQNGTTYFITEDATARDPQGRVLRGSPEVQVWWARKFEARRDETLLIRQENNSNQRADVVELTLGQVYDLIHALGLSVMGQ
jgi:hypothetical protein